MCAEGLLKFGLSVFGGVPVPFWGERWDLEFGYVRVPVGEVFVVGVDRVSLGIGSFWCAGVRERIFGGTGCGVFPCSLFHPGRSFDGGCPVFGVSSTTRVTDGFGGDGGVWNPEIVCLGQRRTSQGDGGGSPSLAGGGLRGEWEAVCRTAVRCYLRSRGCFGCSRVPPPVGPVCHPV